MALLIVTCDVKMEHAFACRHADSGARISRIINASGTVLTMAEYSIVIEKWAIWMIPLQ